MTTINVVRIGARDFLSRYFNPAPGQHVSLIGPTGSGKTALGMALLARAAKNNPRTRAVAIALKPHKRDPRYAEKPPPGLENLVSVGRIKRTGDDTVAGYTNLYGGKVVRKWPPPRILLGGKPLFHTFWPEHSFTELDDIEHAAAMKKLLWSSYRKGGHTLFVDEIYTFAAQFKLQRDLEVMWSKSRSMGTGLYTATQRPAKVPLMMYSQATHLFLWNTRDVRDQQRYGEISGFNRSETVAVVSTLGQHDVLYLNSQDRTRCIVVAQGMPDLWDLPTVGETGR